MDIFHFVYDFILRHEREIRTIGMIYLFLQIGTILGVEGWKVITDGVSSITLTSPKDIVISTADATTYSDTWEIIVERSDGTIERITKSVV